MDTLTKHFWEYVLLSAKVKERERKKRKKERKKENKKERKKNRKKIDRKKERVKSKDTDRPTCILHNTVCYLDQKPLHPFTLSLMQSSVDFFRQSASTKALLLREVGQR